MTHQDLHNLLLENHFTRIERDDRLRDVFPAEILEKGIELWELWQKDHILLVRVRIPFTVKALKQYKIPKDIVEDALLKNARLELLSEWQTKEGSEITESL